MTELQSKEGAELDKRGQRLRGWARSHAGSPGGGGGQGTTSRASGAVTASGGSRSSGAPNAPDPWYSRLYAIPPLGVGGIRLTCTEPSSAAGPSKELRPVAATRGELGRGPPNRRAPRCPQPWLPPRLRFLTPREYEAIVLAALSRQVWDDLLHSSTSLTHREATEPGRGEVLLHLQGSPGQRRNLQEGSGGESATQGTDLLLQKSPTSGSTWDVPPAPPWPDGHLLTLATQTHRYPPASRQAKPEVTSALDPCRRQQPQRPLRGVTSWPLPLRWTL